MHLSTSQLKHKGFPFTSNIDNSLLMSTRNTVSFDISVMH